MLVDIFKKAYGSKDESEDKTFVPFNPFNFIEAADRLLTTKRQIPIPDKDTIYRVSGLSKMCPRQEVLRYLHKVEYSETINPTLQKTFDFGHAFHSVVQNNWFGKFGWLHGDWKCTNCGSVYKNQLKPDHVCNKCGHDDMYQYVELSLADEKNFLTGHPDGILIIDGFEYVMELKSSNSKMFQYITGVLRRPLDAHLHQINMYMFMLGKKRGVVIYFDKDTGAWVQYHVLYNQDVVDDQLGKISTTKQGIARKIPPENRICPNSSCDRAKVCPVRRQCFNL
jgi:hypothetical protein